MPQSNLAEVWRESSPTAIEEKAFGAPAPLYSVPAAQPRPPLARRTKLRSITIDNTLFRPFRVC